MYSIILLTLIIYNIYGETINRDTASTSAVIECSKWPCIINCNVALSCYYGKISCPTTGSGDCTINIRADSAGERSTINTGTATNVEINLSGYESLWLANINSGDVNNFAVNVKDANRALFNSEININSVAGDLSFMVNGNSYHAFYSMKLTISNWITGNAKFIENTDGNGINRNFGTADIQINGKIGGNLLFEAVIDNGNQAFDMSKCTVTGSVGGNVTMKSGPNLGKVNNKRLAVSIELQEQHPHGLMNTQRSEVAYWEDSAKTNDVACLVIMISCWDYMIKHSRHKGWWKLKNDKHVLLGQHWSNKMINGIYMEAMGKSFGTLDYILNSLLYKNFDTNSEFNLSKLKPLFDKDVLILKINYCTNNIFLRDDDIHVKKHYGTPIDLSNIWNCSMEQYKKN